MSNKVIVSFESLSREEQQAFVNFVAHEIERHERDISRGRKELDFIEQKYGIKAQSVYVGAWVEVR